MGRLAAPQGVEQNIGFARDREPEAVLQAVSVGEPSLDDDQRATDDRCHQQSRPFFGKRAQSLDTEREDRRKHDRMTKADKDKRPHGRRSIQRRGGDHHQHRKQRKAGQHIAFGKAGEQIAAAEAAEHHAHPKKNEIIGGGRLRHIADRGLRDEIDEEVRDPDLREDVEKYRRQSKHEVPVLPERQMLALLGIGAAGVLPKLGEPRAGDQYRESDEHERNENIGKLRRLRVRRPLFERQRDAFEAGARRRAAEDQITAEIGAKKVPAELNACTSVSRDADVSGVPITAT